MPGRIFVDVTPLRQSREFRLLFAGTLVGTLGSALTMVAIPYQVYAETRSSFQVGAVSLAQLLPLIVGALVGGSVGDAVDRRTLILGSSVALGLTSVGLALNSAAAHPSVLAIYLVSAVAAGLTGFNNTARNAVVPNLVDPRHLVAAYSFTQIVFQLGVVVGPALSGLLIGAVRLPWVYGTDAVTYGITVVAVLLMAPIPPAAGARRPGLGSVVEGLRYLKGRQPLQGVYLIDVNAMVFGMPRALFPALAADVFHQGAAVLGYLYAAVGVGGLLGSATTGWVSRIRRQGLTVILAVAVWGAAIALFGISRVLVLSLVLLALAGWADVISAVLRNTILMTSIPERFRSRMSSIQMAVVQGGPRLGDLESGAVASAVSTEFSIVSGGLACIAGAVVLSTLLPAFRRYRAPSGEPRPGDEAEPQIA
ncbi:MAG TPA: MFS transporter [Acidimicrobiales bacterium]|nr:MFS transporter [Acidimicrobiales bacterium]